jgi:hypothetical protein
MLFLTRTRKRWIAVAGVTLVAFAHATIAVSGCLSNMMPSSEAGCEEHQQQTPSDGLVCRAHLQAETQTLDLAKPVSVLPFDAPVLLLAPERAVARTEIGVPLSARAPVAGAPPPLNILYSRFLT